MYCRNCGEHVLGDMMFCPRCGFQIQQPKKICYYCQMPLKENETICPGCGRDQNVNNQIEEDPYKGYWKKPILWIVLIALLICSVFIGNYISENPLTVSEKKETTIKLSGEMSKNNIFANNQYGGYAIMDQENIYCVQNKKLYFAPISQPTSMKEMIDDCVGYLSIDENYLYYCNKYYDYYRYDFKTKEKTKLIENIYYPVVIDHQLFYQLDSDNESLHCIDMNTGKDTKYNDCTTYHITVDKDNHMIYYVSYVDENYSLRSICMDGTQDKKIKDIQNGCFVMDEDNIYLCNETSVIKINKKNKKETILKENNIFSGINIVGDKIVFHSANAIYVMSKDGKNEKEIYNGMIDTIQVIGNQIILSSYDENYEQRISVLDLEGNSVELFDNFNSGEEV
ncbi:MAG: DUF5050 domain-containing protein [Faecalibacillus sp.]